MISHDSQKTTASRGHLNICDPGREKKHLRVILSIVANFLHVRAAERERGVWSNKRGVQRGGNDDGSRRSE